MLLNKRQLRNFWNKVSISGDNDCWNWTAGTTEKGYGKFGVNYKTEYAHRIAFTLSNGPIDGNLLVCHSCDNPSCCNPQRN